MEITISPRHRKAVKSYLERLQHEQIPFALGGAFAMHHYTGIWRDTKDMDIFLLPEDADRALEVARTLSYTAWVENKNWISKVRTDGYLIDVIYANGNWLGQVTVEWLRRAQPSRLFDLDIEVLAPEEIIWSKAYVAHRERYDGADILHLIRYASDKIDWQHLLNHFRAHRNLLLSYVALFAFAYPWEIERIPEDIVKELSDGLLLRRERGALGNHFCWGMLLDEKMFAFDVEMGGCTDPREILAVARGADPAEVRRERQATWKQQSAEAA